MSKAVLVDQQPAETVAAAFLEANGLDWKSSETAATATGGLLGVRSGGAAEGAAPTAGGRYAVSAAAISPKTWT